MIELGPDWIRDDAGTACGMMMPRGAGTANSSSLVGYGGGRGEIGVAERKPTSDEGILPSCFNEAGPYSPERRQVHRTGNLAIPVLQ